MDDYFIATVPIFAEINYKTCNGTGRLMNNENNKTLSECVIYSFFAILPENYGI
jgi:hypothetical protein